MCYAGHMSTDTKAIIGWIVGTGLVIAGLLLTQIAGVNTRIDDINARFEARFDDINARFERIESRLDGLDERLRAVEVTLGRVVQRLLTIERVVLPAPEPGR